VLVNALLVRWANGYHETEDAASIAEHGRYEGFLSLGAVQSTDEVERIAAAYFARFAAPTVTTTVGVEPTGADDVPFADWSVADYVTAPNEDGDATSLRVLSLAVTEDDEGNPIYTPELDSLGELYEQQLERWLSRMANGTLGGSSASASPGAMTSTGQAIGGGARPYLPPFSQGGGVTVGASGEWESAAGYRLVLVVARVREVGSTDTVVSIRRNDVHLGYVTIPAGEKRAQAVFAVTFDPVVDVLSAVVTEAGFGAAGLVVHPYGV
jgi:hypothetical protein